MQRVLNVALAFCLTLTVSLDVNAKHLSGGKSLGSAPSHQTRQAQPATAPNVTTTAPNVARPAAAASGASRWLDPLAGITADGLLASMFMGDGFEGIQMLDILLIALVTFIAFRFIAAHRRQQNQGQLATAKHAPMQREASAQAPIFGGATAAAAVAPSPVINAPSWFNKERLVGAAREHFMSLQQHWNANEMDEIVEFVTPQMLQWLKQERAEIGDAYQSTYIDNLVVQLGGIGDQTNKTITTLTSSGVSKTSRFDQGETFSESWRMKRAQGESQPWLVAGIRQN